MARFPAGLDKEKRRARYPTLQLPPHTPIERKTPSLRQIGMRGVTHLGYQPSNSSPKRNELQLLQYSWGVKVGNISGYNWIRLQAPRNKS